MSTIFDAVLGRGRMKDGTALTIPTSFLDLADVPSDYTGQAGKVVTVNPGEIGLQFDSLQTLIESFTTLDLSSVDVTLGNIGGDIVFNTGTTIDWTNTTNTGVQNFTNYTANYDNTSIVNLGGTTNIDNANITNITITNPIVGGLVLPSNLVASNSPTDLYLPRKKLGSDEFEWVSVGGTGTVMQINTTGLISGGPITTSGTISTNMNTNKLVGRGSAGQGVMEEISLGTGLSLSGTTLNATAGTDKYVGVDGSDTTPGYLDSKLNIHSTDGSVTVTKTITGSGNEVLDIDLASLGGGGSGTRSKTAKTAGVVYQAGPNGGILVFSGELNGSAAGYIVYSDSSNPPTTIVGKSTLATNAYGLHDTTSVPILPNMYYKVDSSITTVVCDFYEIGAGTSGTGTDNYLIGTGTMAGTPPEVDIPDTRIVVDTPYLVFFETQPVGNITKTLINGNLNIASDNNADTLDVKVLFWNIGPSRQYMKGNTTLTGAGPRTVTDPRITITTPAMIMPRTAPVGYLTATSGAGVMTISSTGTEVGVIIDYIITLDTTNYSDAMPYNPILADNHAFFRKNPTTGLDEMLEWNDMKVFMGGQTEEFQTLTCGENITIGQHCVKGPYIEQYTSEVDDVKVFASGSGTVTVNYGEAFEWSVEGIVKTATLGYLFANPGGSGDSVDYSLTAKIYAITGTLGSTAVDTGTAILTSATLSGTNFYGGPTLLTYTFSSSTPLPVGQYALKIEGSLTRNVNGGGSLTFKGNNAGTYIGNAIDNTTPEASKDIAFVLTTNPVAALTGDASNITKIGYIGQAITGYSKGDTGTFKYKQTLSYPSAVVGDKLYLSNTPGTVALTTGTYTSVIGRCSIDGYINIGQDNYDTGLTITRDIANFTNVGGIAGGKFHVSYGGIQMGGYLSIYTSDDADTWTLINKFGNINGSGGENDPACQAVIPANKYFKVACEIAGGGTITSDVCYFRPLK